ncbi:MAG: sulfur-carrier protein [Clostridia bacterium]|nr:sulfur-carrier protein [Clostridia bacterium]
MHSNQSYIEVNVKFLFGLEKGLPLKNRQTNIKISQPFTVQHLIEVLEKMYPKLKENIRYKGEFVPYLNIVVNGCEILPIQARNKELREGDQIVLMYVGVGG